jgi:hypothetical protein
MARVQGARNSEEEKEKKESQKRPTNPVAREDLGANTPDMRSGRTTLCQEE